MKRLIFIFIPIFGFISFSCHTNNNAGQAEVKTADSAGRADSIAAADKTASEREVFRRDLQRRLDSMQTRMNVLDSIYESHKEKGREEWLENRRHIKERMNRLNKTKDDIPTVAKEKWTEFKENVDTAMNNLKQDWNKTLDKMKATPK